jgi:RNA polymerase sigma-70 factor, ECF subfamily
MHDQDSTQTRFLLDASANGRPSAFETLFERHRAELYRAVELRFDPRLRGRADPSDVVQETHLEALATAALLLPDSHWTTQVGLSALEKEARALLANSS